MPSVCYSASDCSYNSNLHQASLKNVWLLKGVNTKQGGLQCCLVKTS